MELTERIWSDFHQRLLGFIKKRISNEALAEDILQEVFIKIHKNIASLKDEKKITSWVYNITRNTIIDSYRKNQLKSTELPMDDLLPDKIDESFTDFSRCLTPFINQLKDSDRDVLLKTSFGSVSQKEYARLNNMSYSAVKSRVQRAREKLKVAFEDCCDIESDVYGNIISRVCKKNNC